MSLRNERVRKALMREISDIIFREIKDPQICGMVSITDVDVSPDNSAARVFYSVYGNDEVKEKTSENLSGKTFVITGKLSKSRDYFKDLIESHSGTVAGSVSGKTNYLLAGEDAGSKLAKAEKLGIKIISEEELYDML